MTIHTSIRAATERDIAIGERIRALRHGKNLTQQQLASMIGVQFQQLQKYETGKNRVSATRMLDIAAALGVSLDTLYGEMTTDAPMSADEAEVLRLFRTMPEKMQGGAMNVLRVIVENAA